MVLELGIGIGTFALGIGTAILGVRKGLVTKETCTSQHQAVHQSFCGVKQELEKISEKQDETTEALRELIGFLKGKGIVGA